MTIRQKIALAISAILGLLIVAACFAFYQAIQVDNFLAKALAADG